MYFNLPIKCIAFNVNNNKVYMVSKSNRIQVLNSDLNHFSTFGKRKGQFNVHDIACDSTGMVYIADSGGICKKVQKPWHG